METEQKSFFEVVTEYINDFIPKNIKGIKESDLYEKMVSQVGKSLIVATMKATNNNQSKTALVLGLNRTTLRKKIIALNIKQDAKD